MIARLLFAFGLLLSNSAYADELQPVYAQLDEITDNRWSVVWRASARSSLGRFARLQLPSHCQPTAAPEIKRVGSQVQRAFEMACTGSLSGSEIGLPDLATSQSDALVRIAPLNRAMLTLRLTAAQPRAPITLAEPQSAPQVAATYTMIGVEHIVFGFDHLLFVLALVLLISQLSTLFWAITAFTLAHSLTLAGTTLGYMGLPSRPVEAVIALSIIFLAVEVLKAEPNKPRLSEQYPWLVAFSFGLLHGFGFAGALAEIGMPTDDRHLALLGFNLGVELGQLMVVATALLILAIAKRLLSNPGFKIAAIKIIPTYAIGITGSYWFLQRVLSV